MSVETAPRSPQVLVLINRRVRVLFAAVAGAVFAAGAAARGVSGWPAVLIGWNAAALAFVGPVLWLILTTGEADLRRTAREEDQDRFALTAMILAAVGLSLVAIVFALAQSKAASGRHAGEPAWVLGLAVSTLLLSWCVVQGLYTLHYAHRYFGDHDGDGRVDGGMEFPGAPPTTYRDFLYVAVCVGATCQVSDIDITSAKIRNLVTSQALIAFVFNTMVLALGINIIGNLMGQ